MSEVVDVLLAARDLVAEGWTQGSFVQVDTRGARFCTVGASREAAVSFGSPLSHIDITRYLTRALGFPSGPVSLINWNDHPGRTQAEVIDLFDRAIRLAKDEG